MANKPNILLIFTDMQRADTIHALGNNIIKTPNLDRLVNEGTAFTSCYSPSPVCVPARCCMHYGLYPQKTGLFMNGVMPEDNGHSLPALLEQNGYETAAIGKCHFTPNKLAMRGFGSRLIQEECCSDPSQDDYCKWLQENGFDFDEPHGTRGEMYYIPQISLHDAESHPSNWIGERTIDFLKGRRNSDKPWMLFSSFIHPHPPFAPPKPWHKLYRSPMMPLPEVPQNSEASMTWINRHQNRYKYRDQGIDNNLVRNMKAYYYATISFVDYQIGKMLAELEESGELDNTMIIFASDHGEYLADFNCFGKRGMHDASSRVPLIIRYPKRYAAGKRCNEPVSLVDIMPSSCNAAGCDLNDVEQDGIDLADASTGKPSRKYVFSQYQSKDRGIYMAVCNDWKYVYSAGDNQEFLFDRKTTLPDTHNVAGMSMVANIQAEIRNDLLEYLESVRAENAYVRTETGLEWKKYPRCDESYLANPDAGLLLQDHDASPTDIPGYTG